jgi:transposase InsO family protein
MGESERSLAAKHRYHHRRLHQRLPENVPGAA